MATMGRIAEDLRKEQDVQSPEGVHHYEYMEEVPEHIKNYWKARYTIFSKFDDGIWMTDDAWFGVTSEPIANKIATHMSASAPSEKRTLIDAFAGAGGNTIAFALSGRWDRIFAIEKDPVVLACAKHNAELYGVAKKIWWIQGDCFEVMSKRFKGMDKDAVLFASPPWGGPTYRDSAVFDLDTMQPYSIEHLYKEFSKITTDIALYLPRSSDLNHLARHHDGEESQLQVVHYCIKGSSKALCAYYGNFAAI